MIAKESCRKFFVANDHERDDTSTASHYPKLHVPLKGWLTFRRTLTSFYITISGKEADWPKPIDVVTDYSDAIYDWKTLAPKGRKILVLCNDGVSVRDGRGDKLWEPNDMTNQFLLLDGCSYKQIYKTRAILAYVEL